MAFQVRRGTDAQRGTITPAEGEIIYTTDTKKLYVGDASTVGGNAVDTTVASQYNNVAADFIPDTTNTRDIGTAAKLWKEIFGVKFNDGTASITGGVGAGFSSISATTFNGNLSGNVTGDLTGNSAGTHTGAVIGGVTGNLTGDVNGSVFANDSSLRIDGTSNIITNGDIKLNHNAIELINAQTQLKISRTDSATGIGLVQYSPDVTQTTAYKVYTGGASSNTTNSFEYHTSRGSLLSPSVVAKEDILFSHSAFGHDGTDYREACQIVMTVEKDASATVGAGQIPGKIFLITTIDNGTTTKALSFDYLGRLGVGKEDPTGPAGTLDVDGPVQLKVYADNAARDAAISSPAAGMVVFNTTNTKFQGYTGSAWVDLN
jgi:hypothetical protein